MGEVASAEKKLIQEHGKRQNLGHVEAEAMGLYCFAL
jgi:hypothetical protein